MGWSKDNGTVAKRNAEYAKEQGNVAKQEATNLAELKSSVEVATQNASTAAVNANAVIEDANTAASNADSAASEAIAQANHAKNEGDRAKAEADRLAGTDVSVLDNKIGSLSSLNTTNKTSVVASVNEVTTQLAQTTQDYLSLDKVMNGGTPDKDNYNKLLALINKAKTDEKGLYVPNGKYYVSENLTINGIRNIRIDGEIIMATGKILDISFDSRSSFACDWNINRVFGKVRLSGLKNGKITVLNATELELYANGDDILKSSIAYSRFTLGTVTTFRIFSEGNSAGWINENVFWSGRISKIIFDGNYSHNNNTFYKPMLEGCSIDIKRGGSNRFYDCRFEGTNTFSFGVDAYDNTFTMSWNSTKGSYLRASGKPFESSITDLGSFNRVVYSDDMMSEENVVYRLNSRSKNFPLSKIIKNENSLQNKANSGQIFKSGLIQILGDIGINAIVDKPAVRFQLSFYDINKQLITVDPSQYLYFTNLAWSSANNYMYSTNNISSLWLAIFKNSPIKYVTISISSGSTTYDFENLIVTIRNEFRKKTPIIIPTIYNDYSHTSVPIEGYFEVGDYVKNSVPVITGTSSTQYIVKGWIRLTTGTMHVLGTDWVEDRALTGS